ncbi:phosphatidylserine lipase ABHD16A isoform X2 [Helicoverpa armigera]|uniref:phosphatidylserine lipase ABHD16A isoform X2 n=1 Tax=Helicoverpa armigera TaxID=29058 RepID=UPI002112ECA6|nr:phosphatidylserine lipase ABHD16A isoform X2 [Helicoverpa armigera]
MKLVWQCMFSPRLYKVYRDGAKDTMYQPVRLEKWGDKVVSTANTLLNISLYTSPFICMYIYKRGFFTIDEMKSLGRLVSGLTCLLAFSLFLRGCGRSSSTKYVQFVNALTSPMTDRKAYLNELRKYDFEASAWPTTYSVATRERSSWMDRLPFKMCANPDLPIYKRLPIQLLAFIATHTFGLRLIYPGSLSVVHTLLWGALFQGRTILVEDHDGQRAKIGTADGNAIDTMFVDNRANSPRGRILVICCEGNSGFYEMGIVNTPIRAGFSALGWNHPGFAGSTGLPFPSQEQNAIDAVMQYAINELRFRPDQIVLFGWSIGGYTATWAAVNYPVAALILDATFDDLLPLAENQMPSSWSLLVKEVVRSYVNLNISEMMSKYVGPFKLIRRTEDEIISLRQGLLATNRGNHLVLKLISQRHPNVVENPVAKVALFRLLCMADLQRSAIDMTRIEDYERPLLPLISKYLHDYKSSHCTPLPETDFITIMERLTVLRQD